MTTPPAHCVRDAGDLRRMADARLSTGMPANRRPAGGRHQVRAGPVLVGPGEARAQPRPCTVIFFVLRPGMDDVAAYGHDLAAGRRTARRCLDAVLPTCRLADHARRPPATSASSSPGAGSARVAMSKRTGWLRPTDERPSTTGAAMRTTTSADATPSPIDRIGHGPPTDRRRRRPPGQDYVPDRPPTGSPATSRSSTTTAAVVATVVTPSRTPSSGRSRTSLR